MEKEKQDWSPPSLSEEEEEESFFRFIPFFAFMADLAFFAVFVAGFTFKLVSIIFTFAVVR